MENCIGSPEQTPSYECFSMMLPDGDAWVGIAVSHGTMLYRHTSETGNGSKAALGGHRHDYVPGAR